MPEPNLIKHMDNLQSLETQSTLETVPESINESPSIKRRQYSNKRKFNNHFKQYLQTDND